MKHRTVEKQLSRYLAGELDPFWSAKLEDHLGICPECEKKLQELSEFEESMISLFRQEKSPKNFSKKITRSISPIPLDVLFQPLRRPNRKTQILRRAPKKSPVRIYSLALLALIAVMGIFWLIPAGEKSKTEPSKDRQKSTRENLVVKRDFSSSLLSKSTAKKESSKREKVPAQKNRWKNYRQLVKKSLQFGYGSSEDGRGSPPRKGVEK